MKKQITTKTVLSMKINKCVSTNNVDVFLGECYCFLQKPVSMVEKMSF